MRRFYENFPGTMEIIPLNPKIDRVKKYYSMKMAFRVELIIFYFLRPGKCYLENPKNLARATFCNAYSHIGDKIVNFIKSSYL